ncbi:lycopene cyclase domain-containing protein [Halomicroarcula sp. GCM10025710]
MQYPLTYLQFHAVFILPVLVGLLVAARYRLASRRAVISGTLLLALLAAVYTTPWDRYLILRGAWWYGEGRVFTRFAAIPLGEYLFSSSSRSSWGCGSAASVSTPRGHSPSRSERGWSVRWSPLSLDSRGSRS